MQYKTWHKWIIGLALTLMAAMAFACFFNWDYLRPSIEIRATSSLDHVVHIGQFDLGFVHGLKLIAQDVTIDNPAGFPEKTPFATIARTELTLDLLESLHHRKLVIRQSIFDRPKVHLQQLSSGEHNWKLPMQDLPRVDKVSILQGIATFQDTGNATDLKLLVNEEEGSSHIQVDGKMHGRVIAISGALHFSAQKILLDRLETHFGKSDLSGTIAVERNGPVNIKAKLQSGMLGLADIEVFFPHQEHVTILNAKLNPEWLDKVDAHITLDADKVEKGKRQLNALHAQIDLEKGNLHISNFHVRTRDGHLSGTLLLDKTNGEPQAKIILESERFDIGQLPFWNVTGNGPISGHVQVEGNGNTLSALLAAGSGTFHASMQGGTIEILKDIGIGGNTLLSLLGEPHHTEVKCLRADLPFKNGLWETRSLIMETEDEHITGSGHIDWRSENINYLLTPKRTHLSVGIDPAPLHITGYVDHPLAQRDIKLLAREGGGPLGLGKIFAPAAQLPTIEFGTGEDPACEEEQLIR